MSGPSLYTPNHIITRNNSTPSTSRTTPRVAMSSPDGLVTARTPVALQPPQTGFPLGFPEALQSAVVGDYLSVSSVVKLRLVCRDWRTRVDDEWLKHCVAKGGVLPSERPAFWLHYCGNVSVLLAEKRRDLADDSLSSEAAFERYCAAPLTQTQVGEIARDVARTMPGNPQFQQPEGQQELQRVLHAVVASEPEVGYCQGMNFVAAVLLVHLRSSGDAFWMMLVLLRFYHYRYLFAPSVPLLPLRVFQFSELVKRELPGLWHHLHRHTFSVEVIAHQWIMTLFGYYVEPHFLASIWDLFFLQGWKVVFKCGLTLLKAMEDKLLSLDVERVSQFLQLSRRDESAFVEGSSAALWRISTEFKVTNRLLHELAHRYQTEKLLKATEECKPFFSAQGVDAQRIPNLSVHGFSIVRNDDQSLFLSIDISGLTTYNGPLEGTKIPDLLALSPVIKRIRRKKSVETPLGVVVQSKGTKVLIPVSTLDSLLKQLRMIDDRAASDIEHLTHKLSVFEKEFSAVHKRRDVQITKHEELCRDFAEVADKKRTIQNHLQALVSGIQPAVDASPVAGAGRKKSSITFFKFPTIGRDRTSSSRSARHVHLSQDVPVVLKLMVDTEKEFYDKKQALESERFELEAVDAEYNEIVSVKNLYIKQLLDFSLQTQGLVHETVWRSLNGAAEAFAIQDQNINRSLICYVS